MNTILVPVDFSDATGAVVEVGIDLARALQCDVTLLHVMQPYPPLVATELGPGLTAGLSVELSEEEKVSHAQRLETVAERFKRQGVSVVPVLVEGQPSDCILEHASRRSARMIVLGSHGHGALYHLLLGGVSTDILRKAPCPVVVVPVRKGAAALTQPVTA